MSGSVSVARDLLARWTFGRTSKGGIVPLRKLFQGVLYRMSDSAVRCLLNSKRRKQRVDRCLCYTDSVSRPVRSLRHPLSWWRASRSLVLPRRGHYRAHLLVGMHAALFLSSQMIVLCLLTVWACMLFLRSHQRIVDNNQLILGIVSPFCGLSLVGICGYW